MTTLAAPTIDVHDPATGELVGSVPIADQAAIDAAVVAARDAQPSWARTRASERAAALREAAATVRAEREALAELQTREMGKPIGESLAGVDAGIDSIEAHAQLGPLHGGRGLGGDWLAHDATVKEPRGVVAVITPWNDPVAIACGQLAAALVTGNAVVFKPSERAPLASARVAEHLRAVLPSGVLELVHGDGRAGAPLAAHRGVDVVLHTGSSAAGREIARACAERGAKAILENGGKDALVIDASVDPSWAATLAAAGAFANAGQVCTSVERIYVHHDIAEPFRDHLVAVASALRIGPGLDPATQLGPLVDARMREAVDAQVQAALAAGARALCGGEPADGPGCFYPPTVLIDVSDAMAVMCDETFGPVAPVRVVASFDEGLELARQGPYGLAATVLSCDQRHAARACRELPVGTVKVNSLSGGAPGGGAHPRGISGEGVGYGPGLLDELTATKVVHIEPGVPAIARLLSPS